MEPFIGQIIMFGGNFAIRSFALCDGQLMAISSNSALFSLLGTIYGGDGRTSFALPDLRGRVPVHKGNGPGLSSYRIGQRLGVERMTLTANNVPPHSHPLTGNPSVNVSGANANTNEPGGAFLAISSGNSYNASGRSVDTLNGASKGNLAVGSAGGGQPFEIRQPMLVINYQIALQGVFPSRS